MELVRRQETELLSESIRGTRTQAVEDVVVAFLAALHADARLLEQVVRDEAATHLILLHTTHTYIYTLKYKFSDVQICIKVCAT